MFSIKNFAQNSTDSTLQITCEIATFCATKAHRFFLCFWLIILIGVIAPTSISHKNNVFSTFSIESAPNSHMNLIYLWWLFCAACLSSKHMYEYVRACLTWLCCILFIPNSRRHSIWIWIFCEKTLSMQYSLGCIWQRLLRQYNILGLTQTIFNHTTIFRYIAVSLKLHSRRFLPFIRWTCILCGYPSCWGLLHWIRLISQREEIDTFCKELFSIFLTK